MKISQIVPAILSKVEEEIKSVNDVPLTIGIYRASGIGFCSRATQYKYMGTKSESISPETQLLFNDGKLHEIDICNNLAKVGVVSSQQQSVSKRYNHKGEEFVLTGTIDGKFNGILFDAKSISTFRFKYLEKNFPKDYMSYVIQGHIYMDIFNDKKMFFLFKDKNSSWLKALVQKYDPLIMRDILDKIVELQQGLKANTMISRPYGRDTWQCKLCNYRLSCWKLPMERRTST